MNRYKVEGHVTVSAYTYVEADTPEAAIRIARNREAMVCPNGPDRSGISAWDYAIIETGDGELRECRAEITTREPDNEDNSEDDDE